MNGNDADGPRFPGFDVVAQAPAWDPVTAGVVLQRLVPRPSLSFFSPAEAGTAAALFDRLLGQDDEPKVPLLDLVDERLALGQTDGYRYEDMPDDHDAWRQSMAFLDEDAHAAGGCRFAELGRGAQNELLEAVRTAESWHGLPASRVWGLWMRYACAAYYSHPQAWNEIGFGGPAYPRGYANLGLDKLEHWEVPEVDAGNPVPWAQRVEAARRRHGLSG